MVFVTETPPPAGRTQRTSVAQSGEIKAPEVRLPCAPSASARPPAETGASAVADREAELTHSSRGADSQQQRS